MQNIEILITTYKRTDEEAFEIVRKANIFTNCIIRNQCGRNAKKVFTINGFRVLYVCSDDVGLSKNRNELLKLSSAHYVMFLDDDCVIKEINEEKIDKIICGHDITFSKCVSLNDHRPLPTLKNHKNNNNFKYFSGCGIFGCLIKTDFLRLHCIFFDERVGSGTKLLCGEDSLFINDIICQGGNVGVSDSLLIEVSQDESLWFKNTISDEYVFAKGYLYKRLYKKLWLLYGIRFLLHNAKKSGFLRFIRVLIKGSRFSQPPTNVGVFTICDNNNYGNRLQNFALVYYLNENFNYIRAKTFRYVCTEYSSFGLLKNYCKITKSSKFAYFNKSLPNIKRIIFRGFKFDSLKKLGFIVVGSDQIWNDQYFGPGLKTNMLHNCSKIKKISYAISVGKTEAFANNLNTYLPDLETFENLSFRERQTAEKVNDLTNLNSCSHIDPVLLINKEIWLSMIACDDYLSNNSCFVLFLNKSFYSFPFVNERFGPDICSEVRLTDYESPFNLVKLVANSMYVFTDSYHVFLFSLLLNKDAYLFIRDGVSETLDSRFESVISLFKLEYKKISICSKTCFYFQFSKLDADFYERLSRERDRTFQLFEETFNKNEK